MISPSAFQMRDRSKTCLVTGLLVTMLVGITLIHRDLSTPTSVARSGDPAPAFDLTDAERRRFRLGDLLATKRAILFSFINTRPVPLTPAESDPSRAQIVFLKSMTSQYGRNGVEALIVDGSATLPGKPLSLDALINFTYDWQLSQIPVLKDDDAQTAHKYNITTLPTTFLIASNGQIMHRWNGFVSASQLAFALESLVGPPSFRRK